MADVTTASPAAPWALYACYYGPPGGIPALMPCAAGLSYVTCLINDQYVGFCDGSADCEGSPLAVGIWVCPAGFAAVNPACASMPAPKYPGSYVYVCSDAGPTGN